jgi:hypothetical protein
LAGEEGGARDSLLDLAVVVNASSMGKVKGGGDEESRKRKGQKCFYFGRGSHAISSCRASAGKQFISKGGGEPSPVH